MQGDTLVKCKQAVWYTTQALDNQGFTLHPCKSVFNATKTIEFCGFHDSDTNCKESKEAEVALCMFSHQV